MNIKSHTGEISTPNFLIMSLNSTTRPFFTAFLFHTLSADFRMIRVETLELVYVVFLNSIPRLEVLSIKSLRVCFYLIRHLKLFCKYALVMAYMTSWN